MELSALRQRGRDPDAGGAPRDAGSGRRVAL